MIRAIRTGPAPQPRPRTPQCEAICSGTYLPHVHGVDADGKKRCCLSSAYRIDGVNYCTPHARERALEILLEME